MTDEEKTPSVEEIKVRLGEDIPVEEELASLKSDQEAADLVGEFRNLGRQLGETIRIAWQSEERRQVQGEISEGFRTFASELDKAVKEVRKSSAAQKAKTEASELRERVKPGEIGYKTRKSLAQGLGWLSSELANLADQFNLSDENPPDEESD